ncbi:BnaCnng63940D [Brassica napus]|uniref:BnaCnng63940D protein n=1 Tax=Brassica napus TaxID=3708 RepID=A0A078JRQ8_BRANA|nr:BnaCnng63940D [Brassica napus]
MQKCSEVKRLRLLWLTCLPLLFAWLQLSVHFTVIPDEERLLLWTKMKIGKLLIWCRSCFVGKHSNLRTFQVVTSRFPPSLRFQTLPRGRELVPLPYAREICDRVIQRPLKLKIFLLLETAEKRIVNAQRGVRMKT